MKYLNKKEKFNKYLESTRLVSIMNNTKWNEFRDAMIYDMPFEPPYILKTVFEEEDSPDYSDFNKDVDYMGSYDEESFVYLDYYLIEWIKVRPRYYEETGGRLVSKKVLHDAEKEFVDILDKYHIPYEHNNGQYVIRGYIRAKV